MPLGFFLILGLFEMKYMIFLRIIKMSAEELLPESGTLAFYTQIFMKSNYCSIVPQSTSTQSLTVQVIDAVPKVIGLSGLSEPGPVMVTEMLY